MFTQDEGRSLEMLAVAMSEEYGVSVVCNGQIAETSRSTSTGRTTITIPSIPLTDKNYRAILRGYVDHEVGHVRFTDFDERINGPLRHPEFAGAIRNVANIFEDIAIERGMGECFPGCRRNLRSFSTLLFLEHDSTFLPRPLPPLDADQVLETLLPKGKAGVHDLAARIWASVTQYVLYRARCDILPRFSRRLPLFREPLERFAPGLADRLEPLLARVPAEGKSTEANNALALELIRTALDHFVELAGRPDHFFTEEMLKSLRWILRNGGTAKDSVDISRMAELLVDMVAQTIDPSLLENQITLHDAKGSDEWEARLEDLSPEEQLEALQASAKMDAQMQALLQSFELNRAGPFRAGRLDTKALHKLFTCRSDIFFRQLERRKVNTEVVLCIDMSGSMHFNDKALLASKALFSLAHCLTKIRGLVFSIIGFYDNHVVDVLRAGDRVTPRMRIIPDGGTMCGNTLKFAMQTFSAARDMRKIVIMITDGDANDADNFERIIARARKSRIEFLGVGIQDRHILQYLPPEECCIIAEIRQLAEEILRMLRRKMGVEN